MEDLLRISDWIVDLNLLSWSDLDLDLTQFFSDWFIVHLIKMHFVFCSCFIACAQLSQDGVQKMTCSVTRLGNSPPN